MIRWSWVLMCVCIIVPLSSRIASGSRWDAAHTEGTILPDLSCDGVNGTIVNATVETVEDIYVLNFSNGGYVDIPTPLGEGWCTISIFAQVYIAQEGSGYKGIVSRCNAGDESSVVYGLSHFWHNKNWVARLNTTKKAVVFYAPTLPGWNQIGLVYNGTKIKFFVNGECKIEQSLSGVLVSKPTVPLVLGGYSNKNAPGFFQGRVARVVVCRQVLPDDFFVSQWQDLLQSRLNIAVTFAQAGDLHVTDTESIGVINQAVGKINADANIVFSIFTGDLTQESDSSQMTLARLALGRLFAPYYAVPGNHDAIPGVYESQFGPRNYTFTYGLWKFLMLDDANNPDSNDIFTLSEQQKNWIVDRLSETDANTPIILCTHVPLMHSLTGRYRLTNIDEVLTLFNGYNLKAQISGHWHGNRVEMSDGVLFTTTACLSTTRENYDDSSARGYRLFRCYTNGDIATNFVKVIDYPSLYWLDGDLNQDGSVNFADLAILVSHWLESQ